MSIGRRVLFSTDIGLDIDDALALLAMLNHPEINLCGICTVNGEVLYRSFIAKHMINLAGKEIPVYCGEANPFFDLVPPYSNLGIEEVLVDNSFVDWEETERQSYKQHVFKPLEAAGIIVMG